MRFRSYDNLRLFDVVARHLSFSAAAETLHLTKGAISYQIKCLERELGFAVFIRQPRGILLTERGKRLWHASQVAFSDLEAEISRLREADAERITIGLSTYFASRWLSPRLMTFMVEHPSIALRLQPAMDLDDFRRDNIDMAIRWGRGDWADTEVERLFHCPAMPTAGRAIAEQIDAQGLAACLPSLTLLQDREDSQAWADWHRAAGLNYRATRHDLVIPDPNVRVQAVIDGQGLALNDALVRAELSAGQLVCVSDVALPDYGYYLTYPQAALSNPALRVFRDWIVQQATA